MSVHPSPEPQQGQRKTITLRHLQQMHAMGEKIAMMTCYDASFAQALEHAKLDCVLIGDSLGMVLQGHSSTLPVTTAQVAYHTACVARAGTALWIVADLPFGSYQASPQAAISSACELMQAGAHMVKLEGGEWIAETVHFLTQRGIPVCSHLGLTPQSVHALGGYRIQGKDDLSASVLLQDASALAQAGASMLVMELMPSALAERVTQTVGIPTIGIGAGLGCSGQVLVLHDALGLGAHKAPRFVRNFMQGSDSIQMALATYVAEVKTARFPIEGVHTY